MSNRAALGHKYPKRVEMIREGSGDPALPPFPSGLLDFMDPRPPRQIDRPHHGGSSEPVWLVTWSKVAWTSLLLSFGRLAPGGYIVLIVDDRNTWPVVHILRVPIIHSRRSQS
jgi:hypothetical protein